MDRHQILKAIEDLAQSQGFYGRLRNYLKELEEYDKDHYDNVMTQLENKHFKDTVEMVLFFEST